MVLIDRSILARLMNIVTVERAFLAFLAFLGLRLGELATIGCAVVRLILEDITKDINELVGVLFPREARVLEEGYPG